jgi:hypothetical protein
MRGISGQKRWWHKLIIFPLLAVTLASCEFLGSMEERAEEVNKNTANYAASAILVNVIRASLAEPLNFVSITAVTGHQTASAGVGLPTIVLGPHVHTSPHFFAVGPNSISASESNDFNVNIINDPQSFAALLRPVDPATIGFFIDQGYEQARVFFLFVSRIQIADAKTGKIKLDLNQDPLRYIKGGFTLNESYASANYATLVKYLNEGISAKVEERFVPQGSGAVSRSCVLTPSGMIPILPNSTRLSCPIAAPWN